MSLLEEIRDDIVDPSVPLITILLKAKILARKLKSQELSRWVEQELGGYDCKPEELPDYRRNQSFSLGDMVNRFASIKNMPIPIHQFEDDWAINAARDASINGSIMALGSLLESEKTSFADMWPEPLVQYLNLSGVLDNGYQCLRAWKVINRPFVEHVLKSVRIRLLDFVLELEEMDPAAGDVPALKKIPQDKADETVRTVIYGNNNVVAAGRHINQDVRITNKQGDAVSLATELRKIGLDEVEVKELLTAIEDDGERPTRGYGERVSSWFGELTRKMLSTGSQLALSTAPALIDKALSKYYGWG